MGDDAEFQMEFEEHGAWWEEPDASADDEPEEPEYLEASTFTGGVPLLLVTGAKPEAVWGWGEAMEIPLTLGDLHVRWQIGDGAFFCAELPSESSAGRMRSMLIHEDSAAYEALVVTHDDEPLLDAAASMLLNPDRPLRDRMMGEMLEIMLALVQASRHRSDFLFVRALR